MKNSQRFWRGLFFVFLIAALCGGLALPMTGGVPARAAPQAQTAGDVVISEFRVRGPNGGNDEFIELYNPTASAIDIGGLEIWATDNSGSSNRKVIIPASTTLNSGQHYLITNTNASGGPYSGGVPGNLTYGTGITDEGGIALTEPGGSPILDQVGMTNCVGCYFEIAPLASLGTTNSDQGYGRGSCLDNNNNSSDFQFVAPSDPQNLASALLPCAAVTNVTSLVPDAVYTNGSVIDIRITFSDVVNVDTTGGSPTLLLETGMTDETATYISGSGSNTLIFNYTVVVGDTSGDLDYVATNSLSLNGAIITGTSDDANLKLPSPGSAGSLGANKNIVIDNGMPPTVTVEQAVGQMDPASGTPINFTVIFSEAIDTSTFTVSDITQSGTATSVTWDITDSGDHMTFTLSASAISPNNVTVIPSIAAGQVMDLAGNGNTLSTSTDNEVTFNDDVSPSVTVNQASTQVDPATTLPINFTVVFSEPIDASTFTVSDIAQTGTVSGVTWTITDSGDHMTFALSATALTGLGTLIPTIPADQVTDLLGNNNLASTSTDNIVTFNASSSVVISQFRTSGPNGANDEYIELYNPTTNPIDISGWKINASNAAGTRATRATIPASTLLRSGQYYLVANYVGYSISVAANLTYGTGIADNGGIALLRANNSVVDQVGMSSGSAYREGTFLTPLSNPDQSYERELGGDLDSCQDTNNNTGDFSLITTVDDLPRNYSSRPLRRCGTVLPNPVNTTTTITAHTPNPSLPKENVRVTVRVTGSALSPAGTRVNVTGATKDCVITLNASGVGNCLVQFTSTGTKIITASYLGDNTHLGSKATVAHQVSTATPTPFRTRTPTPVPPPPLVAINEFVPRPGHDWNHDGFINTGDEYIEILNHGVIDVNLSGYSLDDEVNIGSDPYRLPAVTIKPGERKVFFGSETGLLLSDGGDGVRLLKPNGQLADAYNYSVVRFPDQSYCRLPDNGGLDDWNEYCFPTPGLQNSLSESTVNPPTGSAEEPLCPISDTLPDDFVFAECPPFGHNIWNPAYWDRNGWFDQKSLPGLPGKWPVFAD
ncbi:MAG: lamin tail domain-containing protein [Anaerolineales bacterium]|nr:lamin tail domain-containing protein [Anaerolineales bacterium]